MHQMMNASEQLLCLSPLSKYKTLKSVKQIHAHVFKTGLDTDLLVVGKLLLHCAVTISDALDYARRLFIHFPDPDVFMHNTLIRGFAESETPQNSILAFKNMLRESVVVPDSYSFAFVLKGTANLRCLRTGLQLHCQALYHGLNKHVFVGTTLVSMYGECGSSGFAREVFEEMFQPNVVSWNAMITACFRCGDWKGAMAIFSAMPIQNLTSWNLMLAGYTKAGEFELARQAFSLMPSKDEVSWSTMIVGFTHYGFFYEALEFFIELQRDGMRPNEVSLTSVLSACAQAGALDLGRLLHSFLEKAGFFQILSVNNALIDTYSRCGNVIMARLVFRSMPVGRNIVSYTAMIAAFAMQGYGHEAVQCFHEMEESGIRPDGIALISILYACSHAGLIQQGSSYFCKMKNEYGIEPAVEHYGCMVDLYGRAGRLKEAYDFVCHMPIAPNAIIWRTLLGACSFHGDIELAKQVKEKLSELDPNHSGDHVLLSNVYAVAGKWKDVVSVRRSMMEQRIAKTPGWSMIEVDKVMYRFVAGAKQNKTAEEAYYKLKEIILKLRVEVGYVPEFKSVLHDIEEEEKEDSVSKHSEKLAVAFGLAKLPKGKIIRIVKNLRICTDCHTVMKLISKVYDVEIIARDRSRFHSFRFGCCSCSDYW